MARVTLADVAKAAGVGVATASRALSAKDNPDVSPATRARLREVADQLGYRPSVAARAFRNRAFRAVSIIVPDGQWGWWEPAVRAAHAAARAQGVTAFVQPTTAARRDSGDVVDVIAGLAEVPTEGVLILGSAGDAQMLATAESLRLPVVAIDNAADEVLVPTFGVDNRLGMLLGVRHLVDQGCRRIVYVGTGGDLPFHRARRDGYREALAEAGIDLDPALVLEDPSADIAATPLLVPVEELLASGVEVDAMLCESDGGAAPVLRSLRRAGRAVPGDVRVVGFDDSVHAVALDPPLTSIRQPFEQLGTEAMGQLLTLVGGASSQPGRTLLAPGLVVRASTRGSGDGPLGDAT